MVIILKRVWLRLHSGGGMKDRPRTRETKQRRVVYDTVKNTHSHPTADWIFEKVRRQLPKVSLGTVYRNLGVLYLKRGDRAAALETFMTALRLDDSNEELRKMVQELTR